MCEAITIATRCNRYRPLRGILALGALLAVSFGAQAGTVNLTTTMSGITLSGAGSVPFAASGDFTQNNGFAYVDATFDILQPTGFTSIGVTSIVVDPVAGNVSYQSTFNFQLDVTITEVNAGDFHPALGGQVYIPAIAGQPLEATLSSSFTFAEALVPGFNPTIHTTVGTRTHPLGDINGDGTDDNVTFSALDINYLVEDDVSFEFGPSTTVDDLVDVFFEALGTNETIDLSGTITVSALNVQFLGSVNPPIDVALSGAIGAPVPVPPALLLLGSAVLALGGLGTARRGREPASSAPAS